MARLADSGSRITHPALREHLPPARTGRDKRYAGLAEATVYPNREANLAYFVFISEQRRGFAVEATAAVIAHLRRDYGVHTFLIAADTRNVASHRVAERLGFERVGGPEPAGTLRGEPAFDYCYRLAELS